MEISVKEVFNNPNEYLDNKLKINGWIRTVRSSKKIAFIELNDGTFFKGIQIVANSKLDNFEDIAKLTTGSSISIKGTLVESMGGGQDFEIQAENIKIIQEAPSDYPLQKKRHTFEFLRTIPHLRPRTNTFSAVFRVRSLVSFAIHKFFQERDFLNVHTPIITASDCEGAGEIFNVSTLDKNNIPLDDNEKIDYSKDFFGKETGLTVSGQLEAETYALAFKKVYTFGPTFRAENSNTARHASEFWMIEPEIAFANLEDDMDLAEDMVKYIIKYVLDNLPNEMDFFNKFIEKGLMKKLKHVLNSEFKRITYTESIKILENSDRDFEYPVKWGSDLQTEHERFLAEEHFNSPVFVTDYPKQIKAFYMKLNNDNKTVRAMDLLVPGVGELIGGSQREDDLRKLDKLMEENNMSKKDYQWYLDLRKFGGVEHSGFGLGFERLIMYLTGMQNIRDVISFPRTPNNAGF